ncbi:hypothetical protein RB195_018914 [Necator americanus]|uniref:Uncharacterized protein n=1 Tax=Necator americanus TaxID=51031 RepID=A0ABR1CBT5_NECAM
MRSFLRLCGQKNIYDGCLRLHERRERDLVEVSSRICRHIHWTRYVSEAFAENPPGPSSLFLWKKRGSRSKPGNGKEGPGGFSSNAPDITCSVDMPADTRTYLDEVTLQSFMKTQTTVIDVLLATETAENCAVTRKYSKKSGVSCRNVLKE